MLRAAVAAEVADAIGRKWAVQVAEKLESGPRRYNELMKELDEQISPKVFTRVLRRLEAENIVHRELVDQSPPGVQYRLTTFGKSLLAALDDLAQLWNRRHTDQSPGDGGAEYPSRAMRPASAKTSADSSYGRNTQPSSSATTAQPSSTVVPSMRTPPLPR